MSRESELDKIIKDLIHILVHKGKWTPGQKQRYDMATMERSRRLMSFPDYPRNPFRRCV
jgi:hypothetical protein